MKTNKIKIIESRSFTAMNNPMSKEYNLSISGFPSVMSEFSIPATVSAASARLRRER
jgi:hypothetical protein